jgi:integrase
MNEQWELTPEKFLDRGEIASLLRKADELWSLGELRKRKDWVRDAFLIHTALSTGLRNSEICDLKVSDLRIGNGSRYLIRAERQGFQQRRSTSERIQETAETLLVWRNHRRTEATHFFAQVVPEVLQVGPLRVGRIIVHRRPSFG